MCDLIVSDSIKKIQRMHLRNVNKKDSREAVLKHLGLEKRTER